MSFTDRSELATAVEVRAENTRLDADLLAEAALLDPTRISQSPEGGWSPAQILAHLGESSHFVARELARWHQDPDAPMGRTDDDTIPMAAGDPAGSLSELTTAMRTAFTILVGSLNELGDADIHAPTENVRYGKEPLSTFLDRYVLRHKAGHLDRLRTLRTGRP